MGTRPPRYRYRSELQLYRGAPVRQPIFPGAPQKSSLTKPMLKNRPQVPRSGSPPVPCLRPSYRSGYAPCPPPSRGRPWHPRAMAWACRCQGAAGPVTQHHPAPTRRPDSDAFRMTIGPRSLRRPRCCTGAAPSGHPAVSARPSAHPAPHPAVDASPPASPTPHGAHPAATRRPPHKVRVTPRPSPASSRGGDRASRPPRPPQERPSRLSRRCPGLDTHPAPSRIGGASLPRPPTAPGTHPAPAQGP